MSNETYYIIGEDKTDDKRPGDASLDSEAALSKIGAITISCAKYSGQEAAGYIGGKEAGIVTLRNVKNSSTGFKTTAINQVRQ